MAIEEFLPDWKSVEEVYLLAARMFQKNLFKVGELAQARLGERASRSALQAESVILNSVLKSACIYGLASRRDEQFQITVLPEDPKDLWSSIFSKRAELLRGKITEVLKEEKIRPAKPETIELEGEKYIISYVGPETTRRGVDSFTFSVFDPQKHGGIVLRARGSHIRTARNISVQLQSPQEDDTFIYKLVKEDIRRIEGWLVGDIYLKVEFA